ncbi:MAG TPA: 30S ribosomal protein S17 [Phycisphaerae bacterium]|nr:30S ribosomal protein S17 [Phycisphaerae bacterium]
MTEQTQTTKTAKVKGSRTGVVTSKGSDKTIRVEVIAIVKHPRYGKYVRSRTRLAVHDPGNEAGEGDLVEVVPCRRISKSKSWRLLRVVRRTKLRGLSSGEAGG